MYKIYKILFVKSAHIDICQFKFLAKKNIRFENEIRIR